MQPRSSRAAARPASAWLWTGAALVALLAWDASGLDLPAAHLFGTSSGFALRSNPVIFYGLHEMPRLLGWVMLAALFAGIRWPMGVLRRMPACVRARLAVTILMAAVAVSLLKLRSDTSCPWDLHDFGGAVDYVSHWAWGRSDGGGGHCFPAGHASAAFAWLAGGLVLRPYAPRAARAWFLAALGAGFVLGFAQQVRGAHYMSHTLWTAWICWAVALVVETLAGLFRSTAATLAPEDARGNA
jgi:membrane-associated PAP2 superfamily phosphatase